jgi:serine/threonine protein kinase
MQGTKIKNFEFLKVLGSGSFAVVYEAVDSRDGSIVAIKVLPLKLVKSNPKVEELVQT